MQPPSRLSVPHRDLGVPPSKFERWLMRGKDIQSPVEYSTKFRGNSDVDKKALQPETFFLEITCFWQEKAVKILISARKSL